MSLLCSKSRYYLIIVSLTKVAMIRKTQDILHMHEGVCGGGTTLVLIIISALFRNSKFQQCKY